MSLLKQSSNAWKNTVIYNADYRVNSNCYTNPFVKYLVKAAINALLYIAPLKPDVLTFSKIEIQFLLLQMLHQSAYMLLQLLHQSACSSMSLNLTIQKLPR